MYYVFPLKSSFIFYIVSCCFAGEKFLISWMFWIIFLMPSEFDVALISLSLFAEVVLPVSRCRQPQVQPRQISLLLIQFDWD